ncbi:DUF4429 domain-containing protein [Streptomyces sp. NPDC050560]|uniref:DUF4429 domain-containing protein n=1 Tax=Streptomyces sp. NPDC050560 TaxID=3365630 RepID=UPI00379C54E7
MADIIQRDGTWTFDDDVLRLVPGGDRSLAPLRRELGELAVPLEAIRGVSIERGRKAGRLRLRLRDGADPLVQVAGGRLHDASDPYQLTVEPGRYGVAEYLVDEIRAALRLAGTESGPVDGYLLPGPAVPLTVAAGDGSVSFDGETVRLEWNWKTNDAKSAAGPRTLPLGEITAVEWQPSMAMENGYLRFTVRGQTGKSAPKHDPHAVELWGFKKDPLMALAAAAVQARLPHPHAVDKAPKTLGGPASDDHDVLLRRLQELGELHRGGVLTDEEFSVAKQAVLRKM